MFINTSSVVVRSAADIWDEYLNNRLTYKYDDYCEYDVIEAYYLLNNNTKICYCVSNEEFVKIGKSTIAQINNRLSTYLTHNINTKIYWIAVNEYEKEVHRIYDKYRIGRREWFNDVDNLIKRHIEREGRIKYSIFGDYVYYSIDSLNESINKAIYNMKNYRFRDDVNNLKQV